MNIIHSKTPSFHADIYLYWFAIAQVSHVMDAPSLLNVTKFLRMKVQNNYWKWNLDQYHLLMDNIFVYIASTFLHKVALDLFYNIYQSEAICCSKKYSIGFFVLYVLLSFQWSNKLLTICCENLNNHWSYFLILWLSGEKLRYPT